MSHFKHCSVSDMQKQSLTLHQQVANQPHMLLDPTLLPPHYHLHIHISYAQNTHALITWSVWRLTRWKKQNKTMWWFTTLRFTAAESDTNKVFTNKGNQSAGLRYCLHKPDGGRGSCYLRWNFCDFLLFHLLSLGMWTAEGSLHT